MQRRLRGWIVLVLLAALFTGCVGGADSDQPTEPSQGVEGDTPAGGSSGEPGLAPDRLGFTLREPVDFVAWSNGSFQPHQHNFPVGYVVTEVTGGANPADQLEDLGTRVPAGVPVHVSLELSWSHSVRGNLQLRLDRAETDEVYTWSESYADGEGSLEVTLQRSSAGPLMAGVRYNSPDIQERVDYSLRVAVTYNQWAVPPGVPVLVEVPADSEALTVEPLGTGGGEASLILWGPRDELVARYRIQPDGAAHEFEDAVRAGSYVLMATGPHPVAVYLHGLGSPANTALTALGQETIVGEERTVPPDGELEWTFEVSRHPLTVFILLVGSTEMERIEASVSGPAGEVLSASAAGPIFLSDWWWAAERGDEDLVPGTYEATWQSGASVEVRVADAVMYYRR